MKKNREIHEENCDLQVLYSKGSYTDMKDFHTEKKPVDAYMAKTKTHNTVKTHIQ